MEKFRRVVPSEIPVSKLKPFNIGCGSTKCDDGYHCFRSSKRVLQKFPKKGVCRECGEDIIDWKRIHKNDLKDNKFIFKSMKLELVRYVFWHTEIDPKAMEKAYKKGLTNIRDDANKKISSKIGKANNYREGRQTPMGNGDIIHYAQHATATCCRKCLEYWHNIKMGQELTKKEINFCVELIMLYIKARIPDLKKEPKK